jgi:hypothetical protein
MMEKQQPLQQKLLGEFSFLSSLFILVISPLSDV